MNKPNDNWRPFVLNVLRDYKVFKQSTALTRQQARELDAVQRAIEATKAKPEGDLHLRVVDMVYLTGGNTLRETAAAVFVSYKTAVKWTDAFIRLVGKNLGLE